MNEPKKLKLGFTLTTGGYIECADSKEAEHIEQSIQKNDYDLLVSSMVNTFFEGVTWDETN